jgi:tetratricopeptide (TPR) repeat protein
MGKAPVLFLEDKNRNTIPRWRDSQTTISLGELYSLRPAKKTAPPYDTLRQLLQEWKLNLKPWHASDLMGAALVLGKTDLAVDAAEFVLAHGSDCPAATLALALKILSPGSGLIPEGALHRVEPGTVHHQIHEMKCRVREDLRNAIAWVDLGRAYTVIGQRDQAVRAMRLASILSPTNRFVLRSCARFFLHYGDAKYAHRLVASAASTPTDPWLLAAELTCAAVAHEGPRFVKIARRVLTGSDFPPSSTTELASALGTLELEDGNQKKAKRLLRESLRDPTENSVAQAEWASRLLSGLEIGADRYLVPRAFEARAQHSFEQSEWDVALRYAVQWQRDEPFSTRAAALASYISATIFEDYDESISIIEYSLVANPKDPGLTNNLAFALASSGRVLEAEKQLSTIDETSLADLSIVTLLATRGLVCFRKGLVDQGRQFYLQAMEEARRRGMAKHYALAATYLAREEMIANTSFRRRALEEAASASRRQSFADVAAVLSRLMGLQDAEPQFPEGSRG